MACQVGQVKTSQWFDKHNLTQMLDRLICQGDTLEFENGADNPHWAVYIGHQLKHGKKIPTIVHYTSKDDCCNDRLPNDSVQEAIFGKENSEVNEDGWCILEDSFEDMLNVYSRVRISKELDLECEPYNSDDIVEKALSKKGAGSAPEEEWVIPSEFRGCKHFALYCRYDENLMNLTSEKTQKKVDNIKLGAAAAVGAATCIGIAGYLLSKANSDSKKEKEK